MTSLPLSNPGVLRKPSAVFLDRDGVLIADDGLITLESHLRVLPGVPKALADLKGAGLKLVVVSNQPVVARGMLEEHQVIALHKVLEARLQALGAPPMDGFYFCPHHPNATLESYQMDCSCRKPKPGLLLRAAEELGLELSESFMVGDRPTDLLAGARAGCRTVWTQTGQHAAPLIETAEPIEKPPRADFVCEDLAQAAAWILETR